MSGHEREPIPLETLREWAASPDPLLNHLAFHTAFSHPGDVSGLDEEERLEICLRFLEAALAGRYGERIPDGPYVLAQTTLGWLRQLRSDERPESRAALDRILAMLERLARDGDDETREVVLLGVLEHAFEDEQTRALFAGWAQSPGLEGLYDEASRLAAG